VCGERETSASVVGEEGMKRCWWLEVKIVENVFSGQQLQKVGESFTGKHSSNEMRTPLLPQEQLIDHRNVYHQVN
jgi:hypothetical protein